MHQIKGPETPETTKNPHDLETKYNVYRGWLIPYLVTGDYLLSSGRWVYWLKCLKNKHIPDTGLPHLQFLSGPSDANVSTAMKHINQIIDHLCGHANRWDSLVDLMDWLLWGLGHHLTHFPMITEDQHTWLYKNFKLGLLQKAPHDYWGSIIAEKVGNGGWNINAFYPTPHEVCKFMTEITIDGGSGKGLFSTVSDPCVGSARQLLYASNHSIFLYGTDIDPVVIRAALLNMNLYAPWGALPCQPTDMPPYYQISERVARVAEARLTVSTQMFQEIMKNSRFDEAQHPQNGQFRESEDIMVEVNDILAENQEDPKGQDNKTLQMTLF